MSIFSFHSSMNSVVKSTRFLSLLLSIKLAQKHDQDTHKLLNIYANIPCPNYKLYF